MSGFSRLARPVPNPIPTQQSRHASAISETWAFMSNYYFNFTDGKRTFTDGVGLKLRGLAAARIEARKQIHEMRNCMSDEVSNWAQWKIFVSDTLGRTIFEIGF